MIGKTVDELNVDEKASFTKTITETDVYLYAGITGDLNPAHVNEEYANKTYFKTRIAHGMLMAGIISAVVGTILPGPGTVYLKQELEFLSPVHFGDTITAWVEVVEILGNRKHVRLRTTCVNQEGETVVDGEALVSPPRKKR